MGRNLLLKIVIHCVWSLWSVKPLVIARLVFLKHFPWVKALPVFGFPVWIFHGITSTLYSRRIYSTSQLGNLQQQAHCIALIESRLLDDLSLTSPSWPLGGLTALYGLAYPLLCIFLRESKSECIGFDE